MQQITRPLTNLQLELLKIFSLQLAETEMLKIKHFLIDLLEERLQKNATNIWNEKGYSQQEMDKWLNNENL